MGLVVFGVATVGWLVLATISCVILFFTARTSFPGEPRWRAITIVLVALVSTILFTPILGHALAQSPGQYGDYSAFFRGVATMVAFPFLAGTTLLLCSQMIRGTRFKSLDVATAVLHRMGVGALLAEPLSFFITPPFDP